MNADAPVADSSPAPAVAPAPSLDAMSSAERAHWRLTGEKPASTTDAAAESSPAPAGDQPASTDAPIQAASEPAKGKGVKARSAELDAEIAEMRDKLKLRASLREELARLETPPPPDATPAASSPATVPLSEILKRPDPRQPLMGDEAFFAAYPEASYGQYQVYATKYLLAEERMAAAEQTQQQQREHAWTQSVDAVRAEHPDYDTQIAALAEIPPTPASEALYAVLTESGNARLAYHLATHIAETQRIARLSPAAALVELGKLDAQLSNPARTPSLKTTTSAPPPPPSITNRATVPADEIEAALASGDFRRYKQLANARDIAAAGR